MQTFELSHNYHNSNELHLAGHIIICGCTLLIIAGVTHSSDSDTPD